MERSKLKIGEVGMVITDDNLQKDESDTEIKIGQLFEVVGYDGHHGYEVRFLPKRKFIKINSSGPYLRWKDVAPHGDLKVIKVLYG